MPTSFAKLLESLFSPFVKKNKDVKVLWQTVEVALRIIMFACQKSKSKDKNKDRVGQRQVTRKKDMTHSSKRKRKM
jgi:hypothetical protein